MERVNLNSAGERKKLIWAIGLGVVALIFLWWTFFGFGSGNPTPTRTAAVPSASSARPPLRNSQPQPQDPERIREDLLNQMQPITYDSVSPPATEARRNIFAFYEPPPPSIKVPATPTPTPTPTPPVLLAGVSPANVYARTSDFTLEATGDKFTAELRVTIDGRELPTRVTSPQQLTANVPAAVIANPGPRQVILRSSDGKLYSNALALNVSQPPTPNFTYVGILGTKHHVNDTAIVQDRGNREILNAKRGDVIGGRFRVTSISEKELVLIDTNLKIKHTLAFTVEGDRSFNPLQRPTPKVDSEDDEP